ncbi:MAG: hypothetical protein H6727_09225 [Myxococcales bacterium]|nr:hypothetical protein [Myxococcales bacterium]
MSFFSLPLLLWSLFLGIPPQTPPRPTPRNSSARHKARQVSPSHKPLSQKAQRLLARIRRDMRSYAPKMGLLGYPLDGSYCHIGAAFSAAYLTRLGISAQLFQPRTMHMLTYFDLEGRRYFVDQTMAQFFIKGSKAHTKLLKEGGFIGTKRDFERFYARYIDDVVAFGSYKDGAYLAKATAESEEIKDPYALWEGDVDTLGLNSRKSRTLRVLRIWYQGFATDTSHDQDASLFWTAKYFYDVFAIKVHVTHDFSKD